MDHHLKDFYRQFSDELPRGNFHSVIPLHQEQNISWENIKNKVHNLSRGWYELARLPTKDRIEFSRDFWLSKLPYRQGADILIDGFFALLDDVGIFLTQKKFEDPYEAYLIYSIKDDGGFFRGAPPITEKGLVDFQKEFSDYMFPSDYIAFLQIHDGFCKATDCTGITPAEKMKEKYMAFQQLLKGQDPLLTSKGSFVNPKSLIPFYESFGMPFYQCFWGEWYPDSEMGNVYYSGETKTISNVLSGASSVETMAFPTFIDWLMFYLERIE